MRSLSLFILSSIFAASAFPQNGQTVTLVFVTATSETYKNYEAVIDDVSYYSENTAGNNQTSNNRNTIWLNNFQPGQHTIQVYSLKNGNEQRAAGTPVYTSAFIVRQGFDTKIAVRNNGQVQFSERQGIENSNQNTATNNDDYNRNTKDGNGDYSNGSNGNNGNNGNNQNRRRGDQDNSTTNNSNDESVNTNGNNDGNYDNSRDQNRRRHSRNNSSTNNGNDNGSVSNDGDSDGNYGNGTNQNRRMNRDRNNTNTGGGYDNQNKDYNKVAMSDDQFTELKGTLQKQWIPGSKMTALRNEFVAGGHYFTTIQVKELIEFVTDENNRLELAKASYPTITDQDNFKQIYDVFRNQASKDEMDRFLRNYQN